MLGHYIPVRDFEPLVKEFIMPLENDYFIWYIFKHKCIVCRKPASEINEIIPRSRSKKAISEWKNRVTLCHECHMEYHRSGVTKKKMEDMQQKRKEFLISMDRGEYV